MIEIDAYYKRQAKDLTNMLFDKEFLNPNLTRESIDWLEDYLGFVVQSASTTAAKCAVLTAKMKERKAA